MESGGGPAYRGMQPMGAGDEPAAPYGGGQVVMQERPYAIGLLLAIVTLGIYGWYWHYKTHDELSRQVGRENKEKGIWIGYILAQVGLFVLGMVIFAMIFGAVFDAESRGLNDREREEAMFDAMMSVMGLIVAIGVLWLVAIILFIVYVAKQYDAVRAARTSMGLPEKPGPGWFFGFYFGAMVMSWIPFLGVLAIAGAPIAYYNLQEHYNEVQAVVSGRRPAGTPGGYGQQPPPGYAHQYPQPGYGQQAPPGGQPHTSGYGSTQNAPGYGGVAGPGTAPYAGTSGPASRQPTWGAPSPGYRIGERGTEAPAARHVEQTFRCPRCHGHVTARGAAGTDVSIQCAQCGEGGLVRLPE